MIAHTFLISYVAGVEKKKGKWAPKGLLGDPDCRRGQSSLPDSWRVHNAEILGD